MYAYILQQLTYFLGLKNKQITIIAIFRGTKTYNTKCLQNFKNWIEIGGFDNISFKPNGKIQRLLTKLSIENLLHPFQTFILGQKNIGPRIAAKYNIPLVFYGEAEAEYGNPILEFDSVRDSSYWLSNNKDNFFLAGITMKKLMSEHKVSYHDLKPYLPLDEKEIGNDGVEY
mgnify:CR=1 FL=1